MRRCLQAVVLLGAVLAVPLSATAGERTARRPIELAASVLRAIPARDAVRHAGDRKRAVALTFDDGPGPATPRVLGLLARYRAHATFFVIGRQIAGEAAVLREAVAGGNCVENHTWAHVDLRAAAPALRRQQLGDTTVAIARAAGRRPVLFRPPFGATDASVNLLGRRLGLVPVLWSVDTRDWQDPPPGVIAERALAGARPGAIILLHDGGGDRSRTLAALPAILAGLRARGLEAVTVPELLAGSPPSRTGGALTR